MKAAGCAFILVGFFFILAGIAGMLRYRKFYQRLLVCSLADTVGAAFVLIGAALFHSFFFSVKSLLCLAAVILINPLITHKMGRAAFWSNEEKEQEKIRDQISKDGKE